jgi:hypothetical protein
MRLPRLSRQLARYRPTLCIWATGAPARRWEQLHVVRLVDPTWKDATELFDWMK